MSKTKVIDVYYKDSIMCTGEITYDDAFINICSMSLDGVKISVLYLMDMDYGIYIPREIYDKLQESINLESNKNEGGMLQ